MAREIEILRVAAQLNSKGNTNPLESARKAVLAWAQKRTSNRLPDTAWNGQEFDHESGGRNIFAFRIKNKDADIWALRAEDPDKEVAGRIWTTETVIGSQTKQRPHVSTRLIVGTEEAKSDFYKCFEPSVPGFIRQLIDEPGLIRPGGLLSDKMQHVQSDLEVEKLCNHLVDSERKLPVFVLTIADDADKNPMINGNSLAKAVAGMARVFVVPAKFTWSMTERFGKYRSVFRGAVRAYMLGFSETDDPYRHRLFLADYLKIETDKKNCETLLRRTAAVASFTTGRIGQNVLEFSAVKAASRKLHSKELSQKLQLSELSWKRQSAEDLKQRDALNANIKKALEAKDQEIKSLRAQIDDKQEETNDYIELHKDVEERAKSAEKRAQLSETEHRELLFKHRSFVENPSGAGNNTKQDILFPSRWEDFLAWTEDHYISYVRFTPHARRTIKDPAFEDVKLVASAIAWLAEKRCKQFVGGGEHQRNFRIPDLNLDNSRCGGDEYSINWEGRSCTVDWHIKNGGNTRDPRRCLRIYYFWDSASQTIVIDHLPAHRNTGAS